MPNNKVATRITQYLTEDHARLHALLTRACSSEPFDTPRFAVFREGLLRHIGIEEKLLLPAVRKARGGTAISRAHELRIDHAALSALLVPTPDAALCSEILSLLTPHDEKEEGPSGVYAECEQLLSESESATLSAQAASFPAVRVAPHFDGPNVPRTAALALSFAQRMRPKIKESLL